MIRDNMTITVVSNTLHSDTSKNLLCKEFYLNNKHEIQCQPHGVLVKGEAETTEFNNLKQFKHLIDKLKHNQALILGTYNDASLYKIASLQYKLTHGDADYVTRDKSNYSFNSGRSLMMIDFDGHPELPKMTPERFSEFLLRLMPDLENIEMLITSSSSNGIYSEFGEIIEKKGMHIYLVVDDGTKIKALGDRLKYISWKNGGGYHDVSKVGSLLQRHLFDDSVYSEERLIFESKPILRKGVHQGEHKYFYQEGGVLSTAGLELSENERNELNEIIANDKSSYKLKAEDAKLQYKQDIVEYLVSKNVPIQKATADAENLVNNDKHILPSLFELKSNKHGYIMVQDIIDNVDKFTNDVFIDPLETLQGNEFRAKIFDNEDGSIFMNSFRHGGTIYILKNKDSDNVIENINRCDDVNNLLTIIDNVKENNNISNNDYSLIKNEYSKKYKEITNNNLSNKELNELFAKNSYELKDDGVYYHYEKNGNQLSIKICGYLTIEAITHDNNSRSFGRYLKFKNTLNVINYCYMPMSTLVDKSGAAHKELVDKGLYIENDCFNHVIKYINLASNLSSVQITNKIGWHNDSFVFADKTVGKQDIFYQSNSFNISNPYSELGTLEDWQQNISRYCVGNPLLMFAVSISFSGALLKLCEQPIGIGFHIYGASSKGKSTISNVAASVFGKPSGYIRNWRTTTNGLEGVAVAYNDSTLILDELSQIKPNELGNAIYMLINGSGRSRADRSGDAKNTKKWQISVLSNGEKSVATHSAEEQEDINAGQMIRLLNIPLWGKFGAFDSLHDLASGEELTKKLTSSYLKNHGVAGIKWIEALLSHSENYSKMLDVMIDDFKNEIDQYSLSLTSQDMRALNSFAVVALAGDLATAFGITKWKPRQSLLSAVQCFLNWKSSSAAVNDIVYTGADIENTKILQSMKNFLDVHGNSRFFDISNGYDKTKIIHNSAGFKKFGMDGQIMYIFNDISFKQAFKGHDLTIAINTFKDAGWLLFDVKRHKKSHCINGRTQKLYTIVIPDDGVVDSDEYVDDFFERPKKCVGWG